MRLTPNDTYDRGGEGNSGDERTVRRTWQQLKEEGRSYYNANQFEAALTSFRRASAMNASSAPPPQYERQIILSNIVACRLKIGGRAQTEAALEDARQVRRRTHFYCRSQWLPPTCDFWLLMCIIHILFVCILLWLASQCIAVNDRWAKGHVRLASVYSAIGRSNDACNSLQRSLQLDPSNQHARRMLTQELRRGTASAGGGSADRSSNSGWR